MEITAAIPTIGRIETLPMVLYSLVFQTTLIDELILLDEAKTSVMESYQVNQVLDLLSLQGCDVTVVRRRHSRGIARARLELAERATHDWILMVDDDVALSGDCLSRLMRHIAVSDISWFVPHCFLVSATMESDGYIDKKVDRTDPRVLKWTQRYPWFVPYFNYVDTVTERIEVAGTQCILWNKHCLLDKGFRAKSLGDLPREDTYLTKITGPGMFVSDARCNHFEHRSQIDRGKWGASIFYRIHEVIMEDPEGFVSLFGREE